MFKPPGAVTPAFLASVMSAEEAQLALEAGAGVIDCKDPSRGALGALGLEEIVRIVGTVAGRVPVSATIGDLPPDTATLIAAAERVAATGVDVVKCGFFGASEDAAVARGLAGGARLGRAELFAVLMADRAPDFALVPILAESGFIGVMLDTAEKSKGALTVRMKSGQIREFLALAREYGLSAGLAGSLRLQDVAELVPLQPDLLGFRGALCSGGRNGRLDAAKVAAIKSAIASVRARPGSIATAQRPVA